MISLSRKANLLSKYTIKIGESAVVLFLLPQLVQQSKRLKFINFNYNATYLQLESQLY